MQSKIPTRSIQKRSFLLFELLLSLTLLTICLFPLMQTQMKLAKLKVQQLHAVQQHQKIKEVLCQAKIDLFEKHYTWKQLMEGVNTPTYTLSKLEQSTKQNSPQSGLILNITIPIGEEEYERTLYVEKAPHHPR